MEKIKSILGSNPFGQEAMDLWKEYASDSTPEANFVKDLDKLELIIQAVEYEKRKRRTNNFRTVLTFILLFRGRNQFREVDCCLQGQD